MIVYVLAFKKNEGVTVGNGTYFIIRANPKWPPATILDF